MSITYMKTKAFNCSEPLEYETMYLKNELGTVLSKNPEHHLYNCPACQKFMADLDGMYSSILNQTTYPISNKLLDFACKVSPYHNYKGLFTCSPAGVFTKQDQKTFKTRKLFIQDTYDELFKFDSFAQQMSHQSLSIRTITDPAIDCLLIFFWSKQFINFTKWSLSIPGVVQDYSISSSGTVIIPALQMQDLQNKKIYFKRKVSASKPEMINKIQDCILV